MATVIEPEEKEALIKFRERVSDVLPKLNDYKKNDVWLLRWLRARELNLDKAEEMFRNHFKWRAAEKVDEIISWKPADMIVQEFPFQVTGFDRDGCVVAIVPFGQWNIKKAAGMGLRDDFVRYIAQVFEQAMNFLEYVTSEDRFLYQFVLILDFEGFGLKQVISKDTLGAISEILKQFEANFPETLKAGWVVNAPKYFEMLFNIIKPLLSARTLSKVNIHGFNSEEWRSALLKNIDADQLPSRYGGSKTTCKDYKMQHGFEIFPWYDTFRESEMEKVVIAGGKKHTVDYELSKGHSISWNFRSEEFDIGFQLLYKQNPNDKPETLVSVDKADSHLHLQRGAILAERPGTYTIVLDNSNNKSKGKNVFFGVRVKSDIWSCYCSASVVTATHATA